MVNAEGLPRFNVTGIVPVRRIEQAMPAKLVRAVNTENATSGREVEAYS